MLPELVKEYKYQAVRDMAEVLAGLYAEMIHEGFNEGREVVIVPLPTIGKHVRERGFDHMLSVAKKLARKRGFLCQPVLKRVNKSVQVGASEKTRLKQAAEAYAVDGDLNAEKMYLLVDDVWTTGASMLAASKKMQEAGAKHLAMAVLEVGK